MTGCAEKSEPRHSGGIFCHAEFDGPLQRAAGNFALRAGEPRFADGFGKICFFRINGRERTRAPDARHEFGLDACGLGPHDLRGSFSAREETAEAAQTFVDALDGGGVGQAEIAGRAKRFAGYQRDLHFVEQQLGEFRAGFGECAAVR